MPSETRCLIPTRLFSLSLRITSIWIKLTIFQNLDPHGHRMILSPAVAKHYYSPGVTNWADVQIYAPVDGTILNLEEGWAGTQVMIKSRLILPINLFYSMSI